RRLGVVDRARTHDDELAPVLTGEDGLDAATRFDHGFAGALAERNLRRDLGGGRKRRRIDDSEIAGGLHDGSERENPRRAGGGPGFSYVVRLYAPSAVQPRTPLEGGPITKGVEAVERLEKHLAPETYTGCGRRANAPARRRSDSRLRPGRQGLREERPREHSRGHLGGHLAFDVDPSGGKPQDEPSTFAWSARDRDAPAEGEARRAKRAHAHAAARGRRDFVARAQSVDEQRVHEVCRGAARKPLGARQFPHFVPVDAAPVVADFEDELRADHVGAEVEPLLVPRGNLLARVEAVIDAVA